MRTTCGRWDWRGGQYWEACTACVVREWSVVWLHSGVGWWEDADLSAFQSLSPSLGVVIRLDCCGANALRRRRVIAGAFNLIIGW